MSLRHARGMFVGIGALLLAAQASVSFFVAPELASELAPYREVHTPYTTLALSPVWRFGSLAFLGGLLVLAFRSPSARRGCALAVAADVLGLAILLTAYWGLYVPLQPMG